MLTRQDVLSTIRMVREENLDVRAVTMGINLNVCANPDPEKLAKAVHDRIVEKAGSLVRCCDEVSDKYGLPIVNKRIAVSPVSQLLEEHTPATAVKVCQALDAAAEKVLQKFLKAAPNASANMWIELAKIQYRSGRKTAAQQSFIAGYRLDSKGIFEKLQKDQELFELAAPLFQRSK